MKKKIILEKIKEIKLKNQNSKDHLKILSEIAGLRGGRIKEGEVYINNMTKMTFVDRLGNEFKITPGNVKSGYWSAFESGLVRDHLYHMKEIEKIVQSKKGKIKEGQKYINAHTKMIFIDKSGNEFKMAPTSVKAGGWSPYESRNVNNPDYHYKTIEQIVLSKGGKIKEGEAYINNITKMTFIDQLGNEFKMTPASIKKGQWSPFEKNCFEHICRQIIEQIYMKKFPSCWETITRKNQRNLQLDGYCKDLNIAFEYQGIQHSIGWGNDQLKRDKSLLKILKLDAEKKQECINKNILLLEINYYKNIHNVNSLIEQTIQDIKASYEKNNINLPYFISNIDLNKIKVDFSNISHLVLKQKEIEKIAQSKKGKIKEGEQYVNAHTKITFIDQLGNEFKMIPASVKKGSWSPYESGNVYNNPDYHYKILEQIALLKGGKIKDGEQYIHSRTKMIFIDKDGNEFKMSPTCIKRGEWSPYEADVVRDPLYHYKILEQIALLKGGKIKDGERYINSHTKMIFIDKDGNEFKIRPSKVKSGQWSHPKNIILKK
jgi:hypothetical protein